MCFHFLYTVQVDTVYQNALYNSGLCLFTSWNSKNKRAYSGQARLYYVLLKKIISVQWIKSNWSDFIHYTEIIFLNENVIF